MNSTTIRVGENHATITKYSRGYLVSWSWMGHADSIHCQSKQDALNEWHRKADAIKALVELSWS